MNGAADALLEAEATHRQIGLLSIAHPDMTLDDAYAIQTAQIARKLAEGRRIIGWKIGLTSRAMQTAARHRYARFRRALRRHGIRDWRGDPRPAVSIQPRIEAEIAFVMKGAARWRG